MSERVCQGCGGPLPTTHGNRRYCSENCRKRRWDREVYRTSCVGCGADIDAHHQRCIECQTAKDSAQHALTLDRIEEMWNAGLPMLAIAQALGRTMACSVSHEVDELRKAGRIGYRYKGCERKAAA